MKLKLRYLVLQTVLILCWPGSNMAQRAGTIKYVRTEKEAKQVLEKILKVSPVIDGHNDLFVHFFDCKTCPKDRNDYRIDMGAPGQTDFPRLRKGGVGGYY